MPVVENKQQYSGKEMHGGLSLTDQIRGLPVDTLTRMRLLTPQTGCPNRCSFCSQGAGALQFRITEKGLNDLFGSVKTVARSASMPTGVSIGGLRNDRQGVIHPYYDNDVGSYPHLDTYINHVDDLGAKTAISTVGWSRHNTQLQMMHERIVNNWGHAISGVRFSWTPYTYGWTEAAAKSGNFSKTDMIEDFANGLRTYRPLVEQHGTGVDQVHTEVRFRPHLETGRDDLIDTFIDGHHVINSNSYLLISRDKADSVPPTAAIKSVSGGNVQFTQDPSSYVMVISDYHVAGGRWETAARQVIADLSVKTEGDLLPELDMASIKEVKLFRWENSDGPYYAVNPGFDKNTGEFTAKQLYPKTEKRKKSGYIDNERYFLNTLLEYKRRYDIRPNEEFSQATWEDADAVIATLKKKSELTLQYDASTASYIDMQIIPLVKGYRQALELAGYDPSYFFSPHFTMDTGSSANQGSAFGEFRGLAATIDTPMSPWEDRFHGVTSIVSQRENFWRWSPNPYSHLENQQDSVIVDDDPGFEHRRRGRRRPEQHLVGRIHLSRSQSGLRNDPTGSTKNSMKISELHPQTFTSQAPDGTKLPEYSITGVEIEIINFDESKRQYLLPGLKLAA